MSYDSKIQEKIQDNWAELYDFEAAGTHWRYTSYYQNITYGLNLYEAVRLKRSEWALSTKIEPVQVKITMGLSSDLLAFLSSTSIPVSELTITRVFVDSHADYYTVFQGSLISVVYVKDGAELTYESASLLFTGKMPRFAHQAYCNHTLFDAGCGLVESAYKETFSSVTVSGATITHASISGYGADYFTWGMAVYGDESRMITKQDGNTVYLHIPFRSLVSGMTIDMYPGCDKSPDTCLAKFSNLENAMLMPYIPSKNPVLFGV